MKIYQYLVTFGLKFFCELEVPSNFSMRHATRYINARGAIYRNIWEIELNSCERELTDVASTELGFRKYTKDCASFHEK
jgi:hypothetical protein